MQCPDVHHRELRSMKGKQYPFLCYSDKLPLRLAGEVFSHAGKKVTLCVASNTLPAYIRVHNKNRKEKPPQQERQVEGNKTVNRSNQLCWAVWEVGVEKRLSAIGYPTLWTPIPKTAPIAQQNLQRMKDKNPGTI